jgi:kinetochore protein Nuf2
MSQMTSELASQQSKLRAIQDKLAQDERKVDALAKYDADLHTCVKILEDWEADLNRLRDARGRHDGHLAELAALEEEKADLKNNIKVLNSKLVNAVEALQRYNQKTEDKRDALRQRKAGLEATQRDLVGRRAAVAERAAERNKEAIELETEIRAMHAEMHEELKRSEVAYGKIKDQVVAYSIALNAKIDSFNTLNSTDLSF